jgi:glycosyltransferase involved in cell wall biosynthesis
LSVPRSAFIIRAPAGTNEEPGTLNPELEPEREDGPGTRNLERGTVRISIIVPAFNEERALGETLASIRASAVAFDRAGFSWELIVCNNNSTDRTAEIAEAAGARVVFEPFNQISRARNTGAAHASGEWLLFIDADSHPSPELCADVVAAMRRGRCLAGGATIAVPRGEPMALQLVVWSWNALSIVTRWCAGSFLFCETAAFRAVGGFSEHLFISEDVELLMRLKRYARQSHRTIEILRRHPLQTSARKAHLYSPREFAMLHLRMLLSGGRVMRDRRRLPIWYDGRR